MKKPLLLCQAIAFPRKRFRRHSSVGSIFYKPCLDLEGDLSLIDPSHVQ